MRVEKKKTYELEKCYAVAPLHYQGKDHILVAAEKVNKCLLFDQEGNCEDTVWDGPGGTMSIVQIPGSDGVFLATHKFYSPNDSKEAMIVMAAPGRDGWTTRILAHLPHVHRFDILERGGVKYVIAATICSGRKFKDDWSELGKVYACELPEDLENYSEEHPLPFEVLKDEMLKNHGYCRQTDEGGDYAVIGADCGVFKFIPPASKGGSWEIVQILDEATSDMTFIDFQENGEPDMLTISPFHGDVIKIFRKIEGTYQEIYKMEPAEFGHAIWGGYACGKPVAVIGHRKGKRDLLAFTYNKETKEFHMDILDADVGPANVYHYQLNGKDRLVATNREIDEIAFYEMAD